MSNSSLVTYRRITRHRDHPRRHKIDTITIHCYVGQVTAKQGCDYFASTDREASANYVVGYDGSIGLSVDERDRSWASANAANDNRAVTIEVACEPVHPYAVTEKAYAALIDLVADICRRNHIKKLLWQGDKNLIGQVGKQNMTVHRWFCATACPGKYLYDHMGDIAAQVNHKLGGKPARKPMGKIEKGDKVHIADMATWYGGEEIPDWVKKKSWVVSEMTGDRAVLDAGGLNSPIHTRYLRKVGEEVPKLHKPKEPPRSITLRVQEVRRGDDTPSARMVMACLKYRGYLRADVNSDSVFDKVAETALKKLQQRYGLKADGICGAKTWPYLTGEKR